jgi:hypothetical protein
MLWICQCGLKSISYEVLQQRHIFAVSLALMKKTDINLGLFRMLSESSHHINWSEGRSNMLQSLKDRDMPYHCPSSPIYPQTWHIRIAFTAKNKKTKEAYLFVGTWYLQWFLLLIGLRNVWHFRCLIAFLKNCNTVNTAVNTCDAMYKHP